jgi:hypothetical protein
MPKEVCQGKENDIEIKNLSGKRNVLKKLEKEVNELYELKQLRLQENVNKFN